MDDLMLKTHGILEETKQDQAGNLLKIMTIENDFCKAQIAYRGAQILQFFDKTLGKDLLWCSEQSSFKPLKAIRGGIPLCFPWFGANKKNANLPAHGFARNQDWQLKAVEYVEDQGHRLKFALQDNAATRQIWDYAFQIELELHLGRELQLNLQVINQDQHDFEFTFAWHSYFAVENITQTQISGLENMLFLDQLTGQQHTQMGLIRFDQETDRIYQQTQQSYQILEQHQAHIEIQSQDCPNVVVWNPWIEKTQRLGDVALDAWQSFVCVECGHIMPEAKQLQAGQQLEFKLRLQIIAEEMQLSVA